MTDRPPTEKFTAPCQLPNSTAHKQLHGTLHQIPGSPGCRIHAFDCDCDYCKAYKVIKDTLVEVILSQKKSLDYNGFYSAFLMGQLSEEEFSTIVNKFTYDQKVIDINILTSKVNILLDLTGIDYSPSELADIFQCNNTDIAIAITLITGNEALEISK